MSNLLISNNVSDLISTPLKKNESLLHQTSINAHITTSSVTLTKSDQSLAPLTLSFTDRKTQKRLQTVNKSQPIIKAFNIIKPRKHNLLLIDLTAGFGLDSLILSTLGLPLISIEKNPITAAILTTLVHQYKEIQADLNWQVFNSCSIDWLNQQNKPCATHIYLDPFFQKKKTALPKNTMQWLQDLDTILMPSNEKKLFTAAYQYASERVIVKRDKHADFITQQKPNQGCIIQKTSRFDCYKPYTNTEDLN